MSRIDCGLIDEIAEALGPPSVSRPAQRDPQIFDADIGP